MGATAVHCAHIAVDWESEKKVWRLETPLVTLQPFLRIEHAGAKFTATGKVTDNVTAEGMGVEFIEMESSDRAILEKLLAKKSLSDEKSR